MFGLGMVTGGDSSYSFSSTVISGCQYFETVFENCKDHFQKVLVTVTITFKSDGDTSHSLIYQYRYVEVV